jgi:hypothetical protein
MVAVVIVAVDVLVADAVAHAAAAADATAAAEASAAAAAAVVAAETAAAADAAAAAADDDNGDNNDDDDDNDEDDDDDDEDHDDNDDDDDNAGRLFADVAPLTCNGICKGTCSRNRASYMAARCQRPEGTSQEFCFSDYFPTTTSNEQRKMWVLDGAVLVSEEPVREDKYTLSLSAGHATV